ncbi:restriction endonuclease subunit S [Thiocapsa marina]|nr:restriction endonuclease subunit S [Thiocapsa marina]
MPNYWKSDRLKDVATINGRSLAASTDPDFEFDYLEISNVDFRGVIDATAIPRLRYAVAPSRARRLVQRGDILVSSVRPNLQSIVLIDGGMEQLVCSTGFNVVQPKDWHFKSRFAYYTLVSDSARQYFEATAKGVGYPAVDDRDFNALEVPMPPLSEQERIADYLDASCAAIDAAAATKRRQIARLDLLRASIIEKAVTQGLSAHARHTKIDQDWIGSLPDRWSVTRIKRLVSRLDYGISVRTEPEGRHAVLKMGNIQAGEIVFSKMEFVQEVTEDLLLAHNDLLYNRTNSPDQVGKAALFRGKEDDGVTFASYLVRLRVNHRIMPEFLNYVANSEGFLSFARKLAIPSVQQSNLNSTRYSRMLIPLPPFDEQRAICDYLDTKLGNVKETIAIIERQIGTLTAYRKSLIHECVTGQRRITAADVERVAAHA